MTKTELKQYRALVVEVNRLKAQLGAVESPDHTKLMEFYEAAVAEQEAQQLAIEQAIASLGDTPERLVIRFRYIEGRSWPAIVWEMQNLGYSERTVYRLHGTALLKLKEY